MKTVLPTLLITFSLSCFGLLPGSQAVSPPPDGGYPGGNTAEGENALLNLGSGFYNAGIGLDSLLSITDGSFCTGVGAGTLLVNTASENTATGAGALLSNTTGAGNTANGTFALLTTPMPPTTQPLERPLFYSIPLAAKIQQLVLRRLKRT